MLRIAMTVVLLMLVPQVGLGELNKEWLDLDRANLKSLVKLLKEDCSHLDCFAGDLISARQDKDESIGFGARRHEYHQYGGSITAHIVIISYKKTIAAIEVDLVTSKRQELIKEILDADPALKKDFWSLFKLDEVVNEDRVVLRYREIRRQEFGLIERRVAVVLGKPGKAVPPEELVVDYEMLFYPTRIYQYGKSCGYNAERPEAGKAVDRLASGKHIKLLRNIVRGYNPEGRLYALETLHEMAMNGTHRMSRADERLIETILGLNLYVDICVGNKISRARGQVVQEMVLRVPRWKNQQIVY
jgi:hypothetical protein